MNAPNDEGSYAKTEPLPKAPFDWTIFSRQVMASLSGPLAFAFFGGYADASGYVLTDAFTGHITGALVLTAIGGARRDWHTFFLRLSGVAAFLVGVAIAELLVQEAPAKLGRYLLTSVIAIELMLFCLGYLGVTLHWNSATALLVICMSQALGLQNGVWHRLGGAAGVHTTFFTGLSINFVAAETDEKLLHSHPAWRQAGLKTSDLGIAFFLGATLGAAAAVHFNSGAVAGAALVLVVMLISSATGLQKPSSA